MGYRGDTEVQSSSEGTKQLEQKIDQLVSRHRASLDLLSSTELRALANRFGDNGKRIRRNKPSGLRLRWTGRLILCLLAAAALVLTLGVELVANGYANQSTSWLAASDLYLQKLVRRVSHSLHLYDTDWGRSLGSCLLENPLSQPAPLCCDCRRPGLVRVGVDEANLTKAAELIDSLYSRIVTPFLLTGQPAMPRPGAAEVDFESLSSFVAENRPDFERGGNYFKTLELYEDEGGAASSSSPVVVRKFDHLFPATTQGESRAELPPPGQVLRWNFHHLSAIRALRRLVPRPPYFGQRTERTGDISLLLAGRSLPPGRLFSAGDFSERRQLAFALPLCGRLTVRLAPKAACCDGAKPPQSAPIELAPGRVLFFPTDCYELLVGRPPVAGGAAGDSDQAALVQIGFIYNGAHPAKQKKP